jgi:DNA polymerase-3 subunit delta
VQPTFEQTLSTAISATLDGHPAAANAAFEKLAMAGTAGISVLRSLQFEVRRMLDAHVRIEEGQASPNMKLRPPVWQSEWPAYRARLSKWPVRRLTRVLERIYDAEAQAKRAGGSTDSVVRVLMNDLRGPPKPPVAIRPSCGSAGGRHRPAVPDRDT